MRIACIHIPQYALQCSTRLDPSLRGAAVAMVDGGSGTVRAGALHAPVVVACSRAAWSLGVRLGMTATAARSTAPECAIIQVEASAERETVRAIADALLVLTPTVDVGGRVGAGAAHLALYAEVPQKTRGHAFGERVLAQLAQLGLTGRVGIADDRYTAWVAAAYGAEDQGTVTMVPRGGSAAFLAPRPLSLLAISVEVQHMLEALGVRTLGEFAALPAPSVARPLEADYRALARGESGARLHAYAPETAIREELVVTGSVLDTADDALSGPSAIAQLAKRLALRLEGRGRAAARIEITALAATGEQITIAPDLAAPSSAVGLELPGYIEPRTTPALTSPEDLARALAPILDALPSSVAVSSWRLRATIVGEAEVAGSVVTEHVMPVRTFEPVVVAAPSAVAKVPLHAQASSPVASPLAVSVLPAANANAHAVASANANAVAASANAAAAKSVRTVAQAGASAAVAKSASASSVSSGSSPVDANVASLPLFAHAAPSAPSSVAEGSKPYRAAEPKRPVANANAHPYSDLSAPTPVVADPLAVVLSTSGALFALAPNQPEGVREHRRTRRGKRRSRSMTAPQQARLFDRRQSR
ncbi:MAG: hypothetical protein QM831_34970 [Kofleriaceae bacterium]